MTGLIRKRLDDGKPPTPCAALALTKSQAYQDAAGAPTTLRAYAEERRRPDRAGRLSADAV